MKRLAVFMCVIVLFLSACTEKENLVSVDYSNSKVSGLVRPVLINESTFKAIYQLELDTRFQDIVLIGYKGKSKVDATYRKFDQDNLLDLVDVLLEIETENSTMSTSVSVDSHSEFEIVFNETIGSETRNYSIEVGKSYLLVYLAGETNNIIKHDLASEQYKKLSRLLQDKLEEK